MSGIAAEPRLALDHLVVACRTLAEGHAWCEKTFGVQPSPGGRHPLMGTHNLLLAVGTASFPEAYLELIAIDPAATPPPQRRWFDLDDPALQALLAVEPRLVHWAMRGVAIDAVAAAWRADGCDPGRVVAAERMTPRGLLRWRLTVRADGRRVAAGALPLLIEWGAVHPADSLAQSGVALERVDIGAIDGAVDGVDEAIGAAVRSAGVGRCSAPLQAAFSSPHGGVVLRAPGALAPGARAPV